MALSRISIVASLTLFEACSATDFVPLDTRSQPQPAHASEQDHSTVSSAQPTLRPSAAQNGAAPQAELPRRRAFAARLAREQQALNHHTERSSDMAAESSAKRQAAQASRLQIYAPSLVRPAPEPLTNQQSPIDREQYAHLQRNPLKTVARHPVSTFSIDVDTGAYLNVRRFLNAGRLPPSDAERIEEMLNYFGYNYPAADGRQVPFRTTTEVRRSPWNANTDLLHIGNKGVELQPQQLPPTNLVFLVDVSGSMQLQIKLGCSEPA